MTERTRDRLIDGLTLALGVLIGWLTLGPVGAWCLFDAQEQVRGSVDRLRVERSEIRRLTMERDRLREAAMKQ